MMGDQFSVNKFYRSIGLVPQSPGTYWTGGETGYEVDFDGNVKDIGPAVKPTDANKSDKSSAAGKYTNAMQAINAAATGLAIGSDLVSAYSSARAYKAQAKANILQARLNYSAMSDQTRYMSQDALEQASAIMDRANEITGQQMAGISASGFDISSGEQRILADTKRKSAKDLDALNRSLTQQAYELWRSTMQEEIRLKLEAKLLKRQAKYAKIGGYISAVSSLAQGALTAYSISARGASGGNVGVDGRNA